MTARQEMAGLLQRWFELTQAEAAAIDAGAWPALKQSQTAKASLKKLLDQAKEKWSAENPNPATNRSARHPYYAVMCRLLSLETRNAELLDSKLRRARVQRESLNEAERNLHNVCRTYVWKRDGRLNCYS